MQKHIKATQGYLVEPLYKEMMKRMTLTESDIARIGIEVQKAQDTTKVATEIIIEGYVEVVMVAQVVCINFVEAMPDIEKKEKAFLKHVKQEATSMAKCAQLREDLDDAVKKLESKVEMMQWEGVEWDETVNGARNTLNDLKSVIAMNVILTLIRNPQTLSASGQALRESLLQVLILFNDEGLSSVTL